MPDSRLWSALQTHVLDAPEGDDLVNPYTREDPALDVDGAATIRRANLRQSAESVPDALG